METHMQQMKNSSQTFSENQNPKQEALQSTSSSPSHDDFSFAISLQSLPSSSSSSKLISPTLRKPSKTTSSHQQTDPFTVDLSPADDIFFHGHLLPLHLLSQSHLPVSPRMSTGSYNDGFSLPANDVLPNQSTTLPTTNKNNENAMSKISTEAKNNEKAERFDKESRVRTKPIKPFSLFGLSKWRKGFECNERDQPQQQKKKKLTSLDLSHAIKKYIRMLFQRRENGTQFRNRRPTSSYSFSSSLMSSKGNSKTMINGSRDLIRGRRGELFSAPASMKTSPTNSGHLRVSKTGLSSSSASTSSSSSSDSTMEELQAAIQEAIAHCKKSSAVERDDKVKGS